MLGGLLAAASACFPEIKDYPVGDLAAGGSAKGGSGQGGAGAAGGAVAPESRPLGAPCVDTVQCDDTLICFKEDSPPLGGPPNGMCTKECSNPSDCPSSAHCLDAGAFSICVELCASGDQNVNKCQGRRDVGCTRIDLINRTDVCIPMCSDDSDCHDGRVCNRKTSLCTEGTQGGAAAGALCSGDNNPGVSCRGECDGVCIERCVVGAPITCDQTQTDEPTLDAACVGRVSGEEDVGDGGFCQRECILDQDCGLPLLFECDNLFEGKKYCRVKVLEG